MGLAIIAATILIRLALWPSQAKALRSQIALQRIQPEIDALRKKYKDQAKQTKALLDFYKQNKISPFSSCLPTLIQLPILFALYQVLRQITNPASLNMIYPFIHRPDALNPMFLGFLDLSKPERFVLPVLAGGLQYIQTRMIMGKQQKQKVGQSAFQSALTNQMTYIFPVMMVVISMSLPAALPLYWIVVTLFAIGQQYLIMREGPPKLKVSVRKK
jgi:YidC/Oxa1 family membrane protein insertase